MNKQIINLTGHDVVLVTGEGLTKTIKSHGRAVVDSVMEPLAELDVGLGFTVPVISIKERHVLGLPPPHPDVVFIVSGLVASVADRDDVLAPSRTKRTRGGRVKSAAALVRIRSC